MCLFLHFSPQEVKSTVKVYKSRNEGLTVAEGYAVGGYLLPVLLSGRGGFMVRFLLPFIFSPDHMPSCP